MRKGKSKDLASCRKCGNNNEDELYMLNDKREWICRDCYENSGEYDTYDECETCKNTGLKILYDEDELMEADDGKYYCKKHRGDGDDPPSEDDIDYMENKSKE